MSDDYTPGPWWVDYPGRGRFVIQGSPEIGQMDDPPIYDVATCEWEPNAHLLAAAPELLSALRRYVESVGHAPSCGGVDGAVKCLCPRAESIVAIAKARGRDPEEPTLGACSKHPGVRPSNARGVCTLCVHEQDHARGCHVATREPDCPLCIKQPCEGCGWVECNGKCYSDPYIRKLAGHNATTGGPITTKQDVMGSTGAKP